MRHCVLFLFVVSARQAQPEPGFQPSLSLQLSSPLPRALGVAAGTLIADPDRKALLIGSADAVTVFRIDAAGRPDRGDRYVTGCLAARVALAEFHGDSLHEFVSWCPEAGDLRIYRGDRPGSYFPVSLSPTAARGMAVADLDQDGRPDIAVGQPGGVAVLLTNPDFTFRRSRLEIATMGNPATPMAIVTADFNGDGLPDLATANPVNDDSASVFLAAGGGSFAPEHRIAPGGRPMDLTAADFNNDGRPDLAFACQGLVTVLAGNGEGSFAIQQRLPFEPSAMSLAAADLDADGRVDLAVGGYYGGVIHILGNRAAGFVPGQAVYLFGDVFGVALADLNDDGRADLIASSHSSSSALLAYGGAGGRFEGPIYLGAYPANTFALQAGADGDLIAIGEGRRALTLLRQGADAAADLNLAEYPLSARFGDFDGDGREDLVVTTVQSWTEKQGEDRVAEIHFLRGLGDGVFALAARTAIESCPVCQQVSHETLASLLWLTPGDFNGDGIKDLAVGNESMEQTHLYLGGGDGSFRLVESLARKSPHTVSGDFNGDGRDDLAIAGTDSVAGSPVAVWFGGPDGHMRPGAEFVACEVDYSRGARLWSLAAVPGGIAVNCGLQVRVFRQGDGAQFEAGASIAVEAGKVFSGPLVSADFDANGVLDLAVPAVDPNRGQAEVALLFGDGTGGFGFVLSSPASGPLVSLAVVDQDGDGKPDLALADGLGKVTILRNTCRDQCILQVD